MVLFEDLAECEWRVLQPDTQQWAPFWSDGRTHPKLMKLMKLMKLVMAQAGGEACERVFWIAPSVAVTQTVR